MIVLDKKGKFLMSGDFSTNINEEKWLYDTSRDRVNVYIPDTLPLFFLSYIQHVATTVAPLSRPDAAW